METTPNRQILVINCGSSSIKFALFELPAGIVLASGLADRLGTPDALLEVRADACKWTPELRESGHGEALRTIIRTLETALGERLNITAIGHRVVHGGEFFRSAVRIDESVIQKIDACSKLAPLHNPAHVLGIRTAMACFPEIPQVAVFDTAFHQSLEPHVFLYAIPYEYYESLGVRRYGMHGTSHHYVAMQAAAALGKPLGSLSLLTAHLGNGCSVCAIQDGKSVDTSMGLTPLEGLMMGTRSGDVDPNLHQFLHENAGLSVAEITAVLNRKSGILGVSGVSNDMRTVSAAANSGNTRAQLAIDMFAYRLAKAMLAMTAPLSHLDAIVFTGGIGENSALIREKACSHLQILGVHLDPERNHSAGKQTGGFISADSACGPALLVIPTNEESMIARSTDETLSNSTTPL
ncbi:MAG: acetate kinase [Chthoniobacterales bacterium]